MTRIGTHHHDVAVVNRPGCSRAGVPAQCHNSPPRFGCSTIPTSQSATSSQFQDLHFATHGVLDPSRPERSYLLMTGNDDGEKRLGIEQIAGLTFRDGLAILSACETALGERVPGAAFITLAAAFSQADSKSIVAALWRVNDSATADPIVDFHRSLRTLDRAAALQRAQLAMMRTPDDQHPYYWASFILIGGR